VLKLKLPDAAASCNFLSVPGTLGFVQKFDVVPKKVSMLANFGGGDRVGMICVETGVAGNAILDFAEVE
jgi:hypothetical protein